VSIFNNVHESHADFMPIFQNSHQPIWQFFLLPVRRKDYSIGKSMDFPDFPAKFPPTDLTIIFYYHLRT